MSKLKFLVDYFPNADWNSEWYSGEFFSEGSFPPLFHDAGGVLAGGFGLSLESAVIAVAAASFVAIACGLYGFVRVATGSRIAGLIAALLLLATNAFWSYILLGGLYPRILGMAFLSFFGFFAVLYAKTRSPAAYLATVLSLAATLSSHLLLGAIGVAFGVCVVAALPLTVGRRLAEAVKLLVPTAALVAYFYIPYLSGPSPPAVVPLFTRDYTPLSVDALLASTAAPLESLPLFVVPVAIVVPAGVYLSRRPVLTTLARRLMPPLAIAGAASLTYALVGLPAPHLFIYNFQPGQALFFAAWFLAGLIGLALSAFGGPGVPRFVLPLIALGLVGVVVLGPTRIATGVISADNPAKQQLENALHVDPADREHRIGVSWDAGSDWINARFDVPQTRGYQQQGVLHADWQYWLESRVWSRETNYDETNFLLDWYAVKQLYGGPDAQVVQKFGSRPDLYSPAGSETFEYANSSPILSARSTRTALVIGSDQSYSLVMRSIALSGFDSHSLIPLRGGEYVDDYSTAELARFDMVILYGYRTRDASRASTLLDGYVSRGGGLVIEGGAAGSWPVPGTQVKRKAIGPDWRLRATGQAISDGIDLGAFAPAVYNGGPWGVSYIPAASVASWGRPVLTIDGDPVMAAGMVGSGRVVWSGLNLPYHAASTRTSEESRLLTQAISWASPVLMYEPAYSSTFVSPQLRRVSVSGKATGVLFKESWVPNWTATVDGRPAAIYRAGPDFMYVPLPANLAYPATVELRFTRTTLELAGDTISIIAFVGLLGWLVSRRLRRRAGGS